MNKNTIIRFIILSVFSATALAASVPNTFTAGSPALASEVNANFAALVSAVTTLETKVSSLESQVVALQSVNTALTADDVVGTYKFLSVISKTVSDAPNLLFGSKSGISDSSVTFTKTSSTGGTFTVTSSNKSSGFNAKGTQCNTEGTAATSSSGPSTTGTAGTHFHTYLHATCTPSGFVSVETPVDDSSTGSGTWALGTGDSITITPPTDPGITPVPFTAYISKAGHVGFAIEAEDVAGSGGNGSGRKFSMDVFIKQ